MELVSVDLRSSYLRALGEVVNYGQPVEVRDGLDTLELLNMTLRTLIPTDIPIRLPQRNLSEKITVLELLQLVGGVQAAELTVDNCPVFSRFVESYSAAFHGSYGQRVAGQLDDLIEMLMMETNTRRGVFSLFDGHSDLRRDRNDIPCTISIQFIPRNGLLHMRVSMRSNDVWLGLPYDLQQFAGLQAAIAHRCGWRVGEYVHTIGSLHLYSRDHDKAADVYRNSLYDGPQPALCEWNQANPFEFSRRLLYGFQVDPATPFETWLRDVVQELRR